MSSLARKLQKKMSINAGKGPGKGPAKTPKARIIMKVNPETGEMQEYHLTKGWR